MSTSFERNVCSIIIAMMMVNTSAHRCAVLHLVVVVDLKARCETAFLSSVLLA